MGSANTDPPLLSLLVKPSLLTWAWPRPTPSRTTSSGDPFSRSTDLPLLDLLATPSKPTWAWPRPTPAPVRKKSSGDPFSANTDPPLLDLLATPSKLTWALAQTSTTAVEKEKFLFAALAAAKLGYTAYKMFSLTQTNTATAAQTKWGFGSLSQEVRTHRC